MKSVLSLALVLALFLGARAQDSTSSSKGTFNYTFYVDAYYGYDLNQPYDHERPDFLYQYGKSNQIGLNMAVADVEYTKDKLTARLGLNFGDFPNRNMAHEQGMLSAFYEANIEYQFAKKWSFMMGMFSSHMGFESALSYDNLLVSHSLASEWTPYYQSGARLTFTPNDKWLFTATVANGTQNITKVPGNTTPALGGQIAFMPTENITINYSNLYVNDYPDSIAQWMYYNNFYATFTLWDKFDLVTGFDVGMNNNTVTGSNDNLYVVSLLGRYRFNDKWAVAGRAEHYNDEKGIYISTGVANPFVTECYSIGLDYSPMENIKFRLESRNFTSEKAIYQIDEGNNPALSNTVRFVNYNNNILFAVQAKF